MGLAAGGIEPSCLTYVLGLLQSRAFYHYTTGSLLQLACNLLYTLLDGVCQPKVAHPVYIEMHTAASLDIRGSQSSQSALIPALILDPITVRLSSPESFNNIR